MTDAPGERTRSATRRAATLIGVAAPAWLVSRAIVLAAIAGARILVDRLHPSCAKGATCAATIAHEGLFAWDAGYYRDIALHGYGAHPGGSIRFFPLVSALAYVLGGGNAQAIPWALVVLSNGSALVAGCLLVVIARREGFGAGVQRRSVWVLFLAPSAFVLVTGYADGPFLVLCLCTFLALRSGRFWWAALAGLGAGLARPTGVLLAAPALWEVVRSWREGTAGAARERREGTRPLRPQRHRTAADPAADPAAGLAAIGAPAADPAAEPAAGLVSGLAAIGAPAAGFGGFLAWSGARYHDWLAPLSTQLERNHRGSFGDPLRVLWNTAAGPAGLLHGHVGAALHVPWVAAVVALGVVTWRRLPGGYAVFATCMVAAALASANLDGFERYAADAFPLAMAAGVAMSTRRWEAVLLAGLGATCAVYTLFAMVGLYVP